MNWKAVGLNATRNGKFFRNSAFLGQILSKEVQKEANFRGAVANGTNFYLNKVGSDFGKGRFFVG